MSTLIVFLILVPLVEWKLRQDIQRAVIRRQFRLVTVKLSAQIDQFVKSMQTAILSVNEVRELMGFHVRPRKES